MEFDLKTLSAALAIGLTAFATAYAQGRIGSAAVGAIVEKKDVAGVMIILVAIPETMVILGFVIAALLIYK